MYYALPLALHKAVLFDMAFDIWLLFVSSRNVYFFLLWIDQIWRRSDIRLGLNRTQIARMLWHTREACLDVQRMFGCNVQAIQVKILYTLCV